MVRMQDPSGKFGGMDSERSLWSWEGEDFFASDRCVSQWPSVSVVVVVESSLRRVLCELLLLLLSRLESSLRRVFCELLLLLFSC